MGGKERERERERKALTSSFLVLSLRGKPTMAEENKQGYKKGSMTRRRVTRDHGYGTYILIIIILTS